MRRVLALAVAAVLLGEGKPGHADQRAPTPLRTNPFVVPIDPESGARDERAPSDVQAEVEMELHGVLLAGDQSFADIGGQILSLGEQINGFTLVEVDPRRVVLEKGEERMTMWLVGLEGLEDD